MSGVLDNGNTMQRLYLLVGVWLSSVLAPATQPAIDRPSPVHTAINVGANPVLSWRYLPGAEAERLIANGSFEQKLEGWTVSGRVIVTNRTIITPIDGTNYVRMEYGSLSRELVIPEEPTTLGFHASANFAEDWRLELRSLSDELLYRLEPLMQGRASGFNYYRVDLTKFAGRRVKLRIAADWIDTGVYFYFDNFRLVPNRAEPHFNVYFGTPTNLQLLGATNGYTWQMKDLLPGRTYYWRVETVDAGIAIPGPIWRFATSGGPGSTARLDVSIPSAICPGDAVPFEVASFDAFGFRTFPAPSSLRLLPAADDAQAPTVVISEIDVGANDGVELMNVSSNTVAVGGWRLAVYDYSSAWYPYRPRGSVTLPDGLALAPGEIVIARERQSPVSQTNLVLPLVDWAERTTPILAGAVLRDRLGKSVDAVMIDGTPTERPFASELPRHGALLQTILAYDWLGETITSYETNKTYQRVGRRDLNRAEDWTVGASTFGAANASLQVPFVNGYGLVSAQFTNATSRSGIYSGSVTFTNSHSNMVMFAVTSWNDGLWSVSGVSAPFEVVEPGFCVWVAAPEAVSEGAGTISVPVRIGATAAEDVVISLKSSDTNVLQFPSSVTIPSGATEALAELVLMNNSLLETSRVVRLSASAPSYAPKTTAVRVDDDEIPTLSITGPDIVREGEPAEFTIHSSLTAAVSIPMTIKFEPSELGDRTYYLRAGTNSLTFALGADDEFVQGDKRITMVTAAQNWPPATAQYSFFDNEPRNMSLSIPARGIEGGTLNSSVSLSGLAIQDTRITLSSSDPDVQFDPPVVTIAKYTQYGQFAVNLLQNRNPTGDVPVQVTASAETFDSATETIVVEDDDPDRIALELPHGPWEFAKPVTARLRAFTRAGVEVPNANFSLAKLRVRDTATGDLLAAPASDFAPQEGPGWIATFTVNTPSTNVTVRAEAFGVFAEVSGPAIWPSKPTGSGLVLYSAKHDLYAFATVWDYLTIIDAKTGSPIALDMPVHSVVTAALSEDEDRLYAAAGGGGTLMRIDLPKRQVTGVLGNLGATTNDYTPIHAMEIYPGQTGDTLVIYRRDHGALGGKDIVIWEEGKILARLPYANSINPTIGADFRNGKVYLADGYYSRQIDLRLPILQHDTSFDFRIEDPQVSHVHDRPYGRGLFFDPRGYLLDPFAGGYYAKLQNSLGATAFDKASSRFAWAASTTPGSASLQVFDPITLRTAATVPIYFPKPGSWFMASAGLRGWALLMEGEFFLVPSQITNAPAQTDLHVSAEARRRPDSGRVARIYATVTNKGPAPVPDAMIGLSLPHDAIYLSTSTSALRGTNANPTYNFPLGAMEPGEVRSVELDAIIPFPRENIQSSELRATVFVGSSLAETNYVNNRATTSTFISFENEPAGPHVTIYSDILPNQLRIGYTGEAGWSYHMEASSDISGGWDIISNAQRPGESYGEFIVTVGPNTSFFRLVRNR